MDRVKYDMKVIYSFSQKEYYIYYGDELIVKFKNQEKALKAYQLCLDIHHCQNNDIEDMRQLMRLKKKEGGLL